MTLFNRKSSFKIKTSKGRLFGFKRKGRLWRRSPAVIFIHGITGNAATMFPMMKALQPRNLDLYCYDLRGRANSHKPKPNPENFGVINHANDLFELMDALQLEQAQLVGHSYGCWIALYAALTQPGRIQSITMLDGGSPESNLHKLRSLMTVKQSVSRLDKLYASKEEYFRAVGRSGVLDTNLKSVQDILNYELEKAPGKGYFVSLSSDTIESELQAIGGSLKALKLGTQLLKKAFDKANKIPITIADYRRISCPVMVFRAGKANFKAGDQFMSLEGAKALANLIPHCSVYNNKNINHYEMLLAHSPAFTEQLNNFLQQNR